VVLAAVLRAILATDLIEMDEGPDGAFSNGTEQATMTVEARRANLEIGRRDLIVRALAKYPLPTGHAEFLFSGASHGPQSRPVNSVRLVGCQDALIFLF
jgi:hypothetical protein